MFKHPKLLTFLVPLLLSVALAILSSGHSNTLSDFQLSGPNTRTHPIELPFMLQSRGLGVYTLSGKLEQAWFSATTYRIIPDDYLLNLRINGKEVDLSHLSDDARKDVEIGFAIDLSEFLQQGDNNVDIAFQDYGGNIAMAIYADKSDWRLSLIILGWAVIGLWLFILCARAQRVSKLHTALYFLVLLGALIQVNYIFQYNPVDHIWSDPARHWEQGTDLMRSDLMALTDPVGYQVFVAVLAKLTLKIPALVAFYTSLLALVGAWVWYRFLREVQSDKTLALCGWAFFSLLPSWTAIYAYFMQETLFIPMLGAALWSTWRCRRKADVRSFTLMTFIWVLAGLTRGIAIPMAAVVCTWLWLAQEQKLPKAVFSSLVLILIMGPLTYRSYALVGHFAPHGMGHLNVIYAQSGKKEIIIHSERNGGRWTHGFGSPSTGAKPFEPFSDWMTQRTGKVYVNVDLDEGMRDWEKAKEAQKMDVSRYLWITKENLYLLFFTSSWPDNNASRTIDLLNTIMRFIWAPLFLVIVVGFIWHFRLFKGQYMLPVIVAVWFTVQCLTPISVNEGRYRKPLEGLAVAQVILWIAVSRGQTRPAAPGAPWPSYIQQTRDFIRRKQGELLPPKE